MIVIIPTRREIRLEYLQPLIDAGARFVIVDDTPGTITLKHPSFKVYNWGEKKKVAGEHEKAFPPRNGACMSFGFYIAWRESDEDEMMLTLGDDCRIDYPDFARRMEAALSARERPMAKPNGRFVNSLDMFRDNPDNLYSRGFPYTARLGHERPKLEGTYSGPVPFNLGLWRNIFDVNAIDKITGPSCCYPEAELRQESVILPRGSLLSVSSGNMQFRRRVLPVVYQLPMHIEVLPGWVVDRFGDIWGGFILKKLMDINKDYMSVGEPNIFHVYPGDVQTNIWKEHVGILVNEEFIRLLDEAAEDVRPAGSYVDMYDALNQAFARRLEQCSPLLKAYMVVLIEALTAWVRALRTAH